jgi:antibiotic biosynthesis monooxygenase (ABM) superfamily enzyme
MDSSDAPHGGTEVVVTQIKPGSEDAYRAFADRFIKAQSTFPGYLGSFIQPPLTAGAGWTTTLRFDTVEHLDAWMNSPERAALVAESDPLVLGFQTQRIDSSFPGWVPADPATGKSPSKWKTASLVLLTLFPVVMLELRFLNPLLHGLHPALATFVGNGLSVALTTWPLMPLAIRAFRPWLFPDGQPRGRVLAMPFVLVAGYAIEIAALWRLL